MHKKTLVALYASKKFQKIATNIATIKTYHNQISLPWGHVEKMYPK